MLLKKGSTGDDVKMLQSRLGLTADGDFGNVTEAKVKEWQLLQSIEPDGIVDDISWRILFPDYKPSGEITPENFNLQKLSGHIPDQVLIQIPETAIKFNIATKLRLAHFLSQCGHESGGFTILTENLNYSADRLKVIFSKYFPGQLSNLYARNPEKIGSRVYANRLGNGDEASGDGYKYRGRGYIQLTGKENYGRFADFIGEDTVSDPDLVATKYALSSAAFYFNMRNIWPICDRGESEEVITSVTLRINGGNIGLPDRIKHFNEYFYLLK